MRANDRAHVFHSWSAQGLIDPLPIARARGVPLLGPRRASYLDFASQLVNVNIGYNHPRLVAAIREQAGRLTTVAPGYAVDVRSEAARLIASKAPDGWRWSSSPTVAPKPTRTPADGPAAHRPAQGPGRLPQLPRRDGRRPHPHGRARRWASEPGIPGVVHIWGPYLYRSPFHASTEQQECDRALQHLRDTVIVEGPATVAAVILKPVVGTNGVLVPPDGYLAGVRRSGRVRPGDDRRRGHVRLRSLWRVVCRGPLGRRAGPHHVRQGSELGLCATAGGSSRGDRRPPRAALPALPTRCGTAPWRRSGPSRRTAVLEHARRLGDEVIGPGLRELAQRHPCVGEVRGLGAMWAVELVRDRHTREPLVPFNAGGPAAAPMLSSRRRASSAGCGRSSTSTGPMSCRRAPRARRDPGGARHPRRGTHGGRPAYRRVTTAAGRLPSSVPAGRR